MALPWLYPVRIAQALFGVIVIGLTGYGEYRVLCTRLVNMA